MHLYLTLTCLLEKEVPSFEKSVTLIDALYPYLPTASGFFLSYIIHMSALLVPSASLPRCYILFKLLGYPGFRVLFSWFSQNS